MCIRLKKTHFSQTVVLNEKFVSLFISLLFKKCYMISFSAIFVPRTKPGNEATIRPGNKAKLGNKLTLGLE